MAVTPTSFIRAASPVSYTVPSGTAILTNMIVTNSGATAATFTVTISGVPVLAGAAVAANSAAFFDLKQVVVSGTVVSGSGSSGIFFHVSGVLYV